MITIPDTLQEIFDKIATHLLTQNKKSYLNGWFCAYRGDNGLKCAAGILIPDDEYKPEMEKKRWSVLIDEILVENKFANEISLLQSIHDNRSVTKWYDELINFAQKHNLQVNFEKPNEPIEV